jgi:hypothetical protein
LTISFDLENYCIKIINICYNVDVNTESKVKFLP